MTDYRELTDDALVAEARRLYRKLQETPRWHDDNDALVRSFGEACSETGRRGLPDFLDAGDIPAPVIPLYTERVSL